MSRKIIVSASDDKKHPFSPVEVTEKYSNAVVEEHGNKTSKIVKRIRTHVYAYRTPGLTGEELAAYEEKELRAAASNMRDRIATELLARGSRRIKPRGFKRAAAYQMK
jgi:hypothetical protein